MKYKLLAENTSKDMTECVQRHLDEGWLLYGHPYVSLTSDDKRWHYQAMILNPSNEQLKLSERAIKLV